MDAILKKHEEAVVDIDNWDDDDLEITGDEFGFRGASYATSHAPSHRDSISSRRSFRSDYESSNFGDENKELLLPGDDDRSTMDAIAAASRAGVPIPKGVPASALLGGTIKRLGGRKIKKVIEDDWELDMDLPHSKDGGLKFKPQDPSNFPENLRRVSGFAVKTLEPAPVFNISQRSDSHYSVLDRFRESDDNDDFFGDGTDTIKVSKRRQPTHIPLTNSEVPTSQVNGDDDPEQGFELPEGPLMLASLKDIPKTPGHERDGFEEWGEGSLGTRFGGTRRDVRSTRSSSISGMSPSVSSSFTLESEDEDLKGLVIPAGPLHFTDILEKRQFDRSPDRIVSRQTNVKRNAVEEDFLEGLDLGDGDVFDTKKITLNRNVKVKTIRQTSPVRTKTAISVTFTNKPTPVASRLSRPNERSTMSLEPVSESGGPMVNKATKPQPRLGHSAQSSVSSTTTPTTPSSIHSLPPHISTPHRRELRSKPSASALRNEPTTTSAQLLKSKRSMPILRSNTKSPVKPLATRFERPPSRTDNSSRFMSRPKTPVDRERPAVESSLSHARKNPLPFLPAGAPQSRSHHITNKSSRTFRRNDSEGSNISTEFRPSSRAFSRTTMRSPSPQRKITEALAREAAVKRAMNKPKKLRNYGNGRELDCFDDLPTSQQAEQKHIKQPSQTGPPKVGSMRKRLVQNNAPERVLTPTPTVALSPNRNDNLPRFARDTNASRIAREQVLAQRAPSAASPALSTITNNWRSQVNARTGMDSPSQNNTIRSKKSKKPQQQKPQLIKPMKNAHANPKGMYFAMAN